MAEPELEAQIKRIKEQCDPPEITRFVLLFDEENPEALPAGLKTVIDAILPKNMPPEALAHFLEIVLLGQPVFVMSANRWGSDSGMPTGEIFHAPSWGLLHISGGSDCSKGAAQPLAAQPRDERRVLLERTDDGPPRLKAPVVDDSWIGLSERETEILQCLGQGASNKVIARELQITESTVKVHVKSLLRKLRLCNRTQAAIWATETRLCTVPPQSPSSGDVALK
ncbi:MAG TPA: response regulator transcription factor [Stellaceae bacterium]|nr:response regulator transcription factor [Stellaceae bacterium]